MPGTKAAKANRASKATRSESPTRDMEFSESKPSDGPSLMDRIRGASSEIYKETQKPATTAAIAEKLGEEVAVIKKARDALQNQRHGHRLNGLRKAARKAGASNREGASRAEIKGLDMYQSILTPADVQRLGARNVPMTCKDGSYSSDEVARRMALYNETLPIGSARKITAFLEPIFRGVLTEAVEHQTALRTQRVTAATMYRVLKKYNDLTVFTSALPSEGLVRFAKQDGLGFLNRNDPDSGMLSNPTDADKKAWKSEKANNKKLEEQLVALREEEATRKQKRKAEKLEKEQEAAEAKEGGAGAGDDDEEEEEEAPAAKKKSSKKSKKTKA